jgi:hypothetical protein
MTGVLIRRGKYHVKIDTQGDGGLKKMEAKTGRYCKSQEMPEASRIWKKGIMLPWRF